MIQFDEHIFQMGWFNHQLVDIQEMVGNHQTSIFDWFFGVPGVCAQLQDCETFRPSSEGEWRFWDAGHICCLNAGRFLAVGIHGFCWGIRDPLFFMEVEIKLGVGSLDICKLSDANTHR